MSWLDRLGDAISDYYEHKSYQRYTTLLRHRLSEEEIYIQTRRTALEHEPQAPGLPMQFSRNLIIPDSLMLLDHWDHNFSTEAFLQQRGGAIKDYVDPKTKCRAGVLIDDAARNHGIDPRLLIVSLQREKGIIRRPDLTQKDMDWACGVGAWDGKRKWDVRFQGFDKQVDSCARTYHNRFQGFSTGEELVLDYGETRLVPENAATYALYVYTPHVFAAKLTHAVWKGLFGI